MPGMEEARADDLRRLRENDPECVHVVWTCSGAGDAEVAQLAMALAGKAGSPANTACQRVDLESNEKVTDASAAGLAGAIARSGVVRVMLMGTEMGEGGQAAVRSAFVANAERRLHADDAALTVLDWAGCGAIDADIARIAEALVGNTNCQMICLGLNKGVTEACVEGLVAGLVKSAVIMVDLGDCSVSGAGEAAVKAACEANLERRLGEAGSMAAASGGKDEAADMQQ